MGPLILPANPSSPDPKHLLQWPPRTPQLQCWPLRRTAPGQSETGTVCRLVRLARCLPVTRESAAKRLANQH